MCRLLAGSYFLTEAGEGKKTRKRKSKLWDGISCHPSQRLPFQPPLCLSLCLSLSLFSSYCSRWGDFSLSSSDTIKECTVISPAQLQQNKELQWERRTNFHCLHPRTHTHAHTDKCIYTAARKNAVNIQNALWSSFKSQFHTNRVTKVKTQNQWYDSCLQWTHWVTIKVEKVLILVTLV